MQVDAPDSAGSAYPNEANSLTGKSEGDQQKQIIMQFIKTCIRKHFETLFVLLILSTTVFIYYFVPQKLAFLDFYFLPTILGAYYLGRRTAILGAVFAVLAILIYVVIKPEVFLVERTTLEVYLDILIWGCFLILSGAFIGSLQEKLLVKIETTRQLNLELQGRQEELNRANSALKDYSDNLETKVTERTEELKQANIVLKEYSENLEAKVQERTEELENSKQSIETLKSKVEMALYSTMDASVVKLLIEGRLRNEKRNVSILFSDLVGFSGYSEQNPPEIVIRDINRYIADMEPILITYHSHIDRYMGDAIMCEFGAPLDYQTYRLLATLAGIKMQEKMVKSDYPWKMRIGVSSGSTITGLIGNKRQAYTAIGDVVNIGARLQKVCTPGRILIDGATYHSVSRFIEAVKRRDLPTTDIMDTEKEWQLEAFHEKAAANPDNPIYYFKIGEIYLQINEPEEAIQYFERAMQLDPNDKNFKIAYADAGLKIRERERISIKGKRQRVEAYEVIGIKNPLDDRNKVSQSFADKYRDVADLIQIPEDIILPVEALDGSIGHSKMVAVFSYALASYAGISDKEKMDILHAGFIADIGKEIVPHHLLNRAGTLSVREMDLVRQHSTEGAITQRNMGYENDAMLKIVYSSHENFNGTGYPDGLKGEEIPLGSRIVAVADAYDALISWRPYRDPWDRRVALDEIIRGAENGLYDPKIVDALKNVII